MLEGGGIVSPCLTAELDLLDWVLVAFTKNHASGCLRCACLMDNLHVHDDCVRVKNV